MLRTVSFSITSDYTLRAMPHLPEDYVKQAEVITTAFLGDPSFFAYNGEDPEPEDPEAPPVERFREVHRLAWTIQKIDHDCTLAPRGALAVDAAKKVIFNHNYQGLSYDTSLELRGYVHFRRPENIQGQALLKRPGIIKTDDFLDCIDKDQPKGKLSTTYPHQSIDLPFLSLQKCGLSHMIVLDQKYLYVTYIGKDMLSTLF